MATTSQSRTVLFLQWTLYRNQENKLYSKLSSSETIFWNDCAANNEYVVKTEINRGVVTILGYSCDELVLTTSTGVNKYYFNAALRVDPKVFQNHKFANWSEVVSKSEAVPLKMILETRHYIQETIALAVIPMTLDDSLFELPGNTNLKKLN